MHIDDFKRVGVIGWGESGMGLIHLLLSLGKEVRLSEQKPDNCFAKTDIDHLKACGVKFEFGTHSENFIKDCQLLVLSPGVDTFKSPAVKIIRDLALPYVGEIEFSFWLTQANCVAITGTNGKSTTTQLTYEVLRRKRKRVFLGGNIGIPFSSFVLDTRKGDLVVLEISSFQLETIVSFKPQVAALLNVTPDHLDRYREFNDYLQAKMNIFRNQSEEDFALFNKNNGFNFEKEISLRSKIIYFGDEFSNENLSCVYRIARIYGLSKADCQAVFADFKGLPHRLQFVRTLGGITFINDSKATNPSSTIWALKNSGGPIILLAGGRDKGVDYSEIKPYLGRVKKLIVFGEAADLILGTLKPYVPAQGFSSFEKAVAVSYQEAQKGDTVLLSPMCASFDMFANYKERGNKFMDIVNSF